MHSLSCQLVWEKQIHLFLNTSVMVKCLILLRCQLQQNRPIYKSSSELATARVVKPMDLNPYKPSSPTKPQEISIQPTYNQDHT